MSPIQRTASVRHCAVSILIQSMKRRCDVRLATTLSATDGAPSRHAAIQRAIIDVPPVHCALPSSFTGLPHGAPLQPTGRGHRKHAEEPVASRHTHLSAPRMHAALSQLLAAPCVDPATVYSAVALARALRRRPPPADRRTRASAVKLM